MGTGVHWCFRKGIIVLIVFFLMLQPSQSVESYNTFFKEYNFEFPYDDVNYQARHGDPKIQNKTISLPAMDIIGTNVRLDDFNFLKVQMVFAGRPYSNITTQYSFKAYFTFNSTGLLRIEIRNNNNYTSHTPGINYKAYKSINSSLVYIYIENTTLPYVNPWRLYGYFRYIISPSINNNIITWLIDLNGVNSIIPLSQIFTITSFSNQKQNHYQNNLHFYLGVTNIDLYYGYKVWIHNEYEIDHVGTPPIYIVFWITGFVCIIILTYYLYRRRKRNGI